HAASDRRHELRRQCDDRELACEEGDSEAEQRRRGDGERQATCGAGFRAHDGGGESRLSARALEARAWIEPKRLNAESAENAEGIRGLRHRPLFFSPRSLRPLRLISLR